MSLNPKEEPQGAPLYVWVISITIVAITALGLLLLMGSVDNLIRLIN